MNKLPIFELTIDDAPTAKTEVSYVALVDRPAIEAGWMAFNEQSKPLQFAIQNEDERVIFGPAMIPDMRIYRSDENGEYFVTFSKDTIAKIAVKFFQNNYQKNVNLMHDSGQQVDGVTFFQSVIKDTAKGIDGMAGDYPDGTWFLGAKVNNDEVWADVKAGKFTGYSVEGLFQYKKTAEQQLAAVEALLKNQLSDEALLAAIEKILN
jgi:hypothetical protein